jgi:hypothetical protein
MTGAPFIQAKAKARSTLVADKSPYLSSSTITSGWRRRQRGARRELCEPLSMPDGHVA